jgi:hypothetical protein
MINQIFHLLILLMCSPLVGQEVQLALKLEKGKVYRQFISSSAEVTQQYEGMEINHEVYFTTWVSYRLISSRHGFINLEFQHDKLGMVFIAPNGRTEFNTDYHDEDDILSGVLRSLLGVPFQATLNPDGRMMEIKNLDQIKDSILNRFRHLEPDQLQMISNQIDQSLNVAKESLQTVTAIFPPTAVKEGDQWTVETDATVRGIQTKNKTWFQLQEVHPDYVIITATSQTDVPDNAFENNEYTLRINGKTNSRYKVARDSGWIIDAVIQNEMQGQAHHLEEHGDHHHETVIPLKMKSETRITDHD